MAVRLVIRFTFLSLITLVNSQTAYRARFDEDVTGVSGRFDLKIDQTDNVSYEWSLDANNFVSPNSCDLSAGLAYHIHSNWDENDENSAFFGDCGSDQTGGHYDPFLACGPATSNTAECTALGRTRNDYMCDAAKYADGEYQLCEVGDLSGKFGKMMPESAADLTFKDEVILDHLGPLQANYDVTEEGIRKSWLSIVFHCTTDYSRQFCAKFLRSSVSSKTSKSKTRKSKRSKAL